MKITILLSLVAVACANQYVDNEYLVGLKPGTDVDAFLARNSNVEVKRTYDWDMTTLLYVHAEGLDMDALRRQSDVKYVDRNGIATTQQCTSELSDGCWGLDRIDQTEALDYSTPTNPAAVTMESSTDGAGANAYILDTGIQITHTNFGGRASFAYTAVDIGNPGEDNNGHGTHCAGTIGSATYGVAQATSLFAVKVLNDNGSGPWNSVIDGMDWVTMNAPSGLSVGSMSLGGGGVNDAVGDAVDRMYNAGITLAVAAGNSDGDACSYSPAYAPNAVTVGATDIGDSSASFTNYGTCVDLFAPGVNVKSTWIGNGNDETNTISGTSMACPHVAGVVARYLGNGAQRPADVATWLTSGATVGAINWCCNNHDTSPNLLLNTPCP